MLTPGTLVEVLDVPPVPVIVMLPPGALIDDEIPTPLPAPWVMPVIVTLPVPAAVRFAGVGSPTAGPGPGLSAVIVMLPVPFVVMLLGTLTEPPVLLIVRSPLLLTLIEASVSGRLFARRMLPLVEFVALNVLTALFVPAKVVPVPDIVVNALAPTMPLDASLIDPAA